MDKKARRAQLIAEMREMNEKVKAESRGFNDDEQKLYSEKEAELRQLSAEIAAEEREAFLNGFDTNLPKPEANGEERGANPSEMDTFRNFLQTGEKRDLTLGTSGSPGSGYALAPQQFVDEVIEGAADEHQLYDAVEKIPVNGAGSLGLPYEATDASDAAWTAEVPSDPISADSSLAYGKRELKPNDLVKLIKVSKKMIASSGIPVETLVARKLRSKILDAFEAGILTGDGSGKPLGVFTASNDGVATSRDVESTRSGSTVASGVIMTADDLIRMKMNIKPGYRRNAVGVMHTDILKEVMLFKDNDGQYMWRPGLRDGEPDTILGMPVIESAFAPNTKVAGSYVMVLGDFRNYYKFAYWKGLEIDILKELFAQKNQIGYIAHTLADGMPTLGEAFTRLKVSNTTSTGTTTK